MTEKQLKNLIVFCILMENNDGILGKSPDYIIEKFERFVGKNDDSFKWGLDSNNQEKFNKYLKKWILG